MSDPSTAVDQYLAGVQEEQRNTLQSLREAVRKIAPGLEEGFSYGLPAFRLGGRPVIAYGAAKHHCSLYPMNPEIIERYREELNNFSTSKGTIRFTPDHPLPVDLLEKIVQSRIADLAGDR